MKNNIKEFALKLNKYGSFAVFCHYRPDGDTIGSALALKNGLKKIGKKAEIFCDDKIPDRFTFLEAVKEIHRDFFGEYEAFIAVDCADIQRTGKFFDIFEKKKETFSIDHHVGNTYFAKENCVIDSASNCENVYELLKALSVELDNETATYLMLGIITDTGGFSHSNVNENTFAVAKELMRCKVDVDGINYYMFENQTFERAKLFGLTMSKIRSFADGKIAIITVTRENIEKTGAATEETEGFIDFIMGISGVEVGMCLLEMREEEYKVSFRSKKTDVNAVAGVYGGGGHVRASGCMIKGPYEEVVEKLVFTVLQYLED